MFQKFTKQGFHNAMQKTKNFMGNAYHHTKSFLGQVDNGLRTAKKVYQILEPTISHFVGQNNQGHRGAMKALQGYEDIRHKIISGHNQIEDHVNTVSNKFKRAGMNIGI